MGAFAAGTVVIVPFPFSDLSQSKFRPAIVLAECGRGDHMLCQVTSNAYGDARAVAITNADFNSGALLRPSYARPGKVFTAHQSLIANRIGELHQRSLRGIVDAVIALLQGAPP